MISSPLILPSSHDGPESDRTTVVTGDEFHLINSESFESAAPPRILVAICSAHGYQARREACRQTWLQRLPPNVAAFFFVGTGYMSAGEPDVLRIGAPDDYTNLPRKVAALMRYAAAHFEFDYLFKCDDDTYVVAHRLQELAGGDMCALLWNSRTASGGAGYLLSRSLVERIADEIHEAGAYEDVEVTLAVRRVNASINSTHRLQLGNNRLPAPKNDLITAHWCSPEKLYEIDREWQQTSGRPGRAERFVIVGLSGSLGTQMFQYAHGLAVAKQCQADVLLAWASPPSTPTGQFELGSFGLKLAERLPSPAEAHSVSEYGSYVAGMEDAIVKEFTASGKQICFLNGYFQNERLFAAMAGEIRRVFKINETDRSPARNGARVAVHVRRKGPHANPQHVLPSPGYYLTAMRIVRSLIGEAVFLIFTNDAEWCRSAFPDAGDVQYCWSENEFSDLQEMAACDAFILSNSTLGWWAAWLSAAELVICPSRCVRGIDWRRVPERWVQIPPDGVLPTSPPFTCNGKRVFKQTWWDRNTADRQADYRKWTGDVESPSRIAVREHVATLGIQSILDCGCGYCVDQPEYERMAPPVRYAGIDASITFVEFARARGLDVSFGYAESLPFADKAFDMVHFRHVLEHLPYYTDALQEACRVARRLVAVVWYLPPADNADRLLFDSGESLHQNTYNRAGIEKLIDQIKPGATVEWNRVGDRECILWINLQPVEK